MIVPSSIFTAHGWLSMAQRKHSPGGVSCWRLTGAAINILYSCNTTWTGIAGSVRDEQIFVKGLVLIGSASSVCIECALAMATARVAPTIYGLREPLRHMV